MKRDLGALAGVEHDLVIVGGGAFGACVAWEAVSRGLSVALLEKDDFCQATSANHLKVVHGGIRYLQHLDVRRVRESCRERSALLRIAPHLVQPLPILMPTFGRGLEGRAVLRAGLLLYDLVAFDRNAGIGDVGRHIPAGRMVSRRECLEICPALDRDDLTGAGLFFDGQFYNPPRLVLAFLRSAVDAGACIANYTEVTGFVRRDDRVCGVTVRDRLSGEIFDVRGSVILNAAGPWAARLLDAALGIRLERQPRFSRDAGFVVRGRRTGDHAVACRVDTRDPDAVLSRKGRHVMMIPWRDYTLVGSWHTVHDGSPDDVRVREEELRVFVDEINAAQGGFRLKLDDVSMVYSGLTLFGENVPGQKDLRFGHRSMLVDHAIEHNVDGLVTLIGVRATTARGMAEKAVDLLLRKAGRPVAPSRTETTPIHGGQIESFAGFVRELTERHGHAYSPHVLRSLAHNHGRDCESVLECASGDASRAGRLEGSCTLKAEVVHAIRREMAVTLADVVFRRTDLGTGGHPGEPALTECARLMAAELNWNRDRVDRELAEVRVRFPGPGMNPP